MKEWGKNDFICIIIFQNCTVKTIAELLLQKANKINKNNEPNVVKLVQ